MERDASMESLASLAASALEQFFSVQGHERALRAIWNTLAAEGVEAVLWLKSAEKLTQTLHDGELHSFQMMVRAPGGLAVLQCLCHPGSEAKSRAQAKATFEGVGGKFLALESIVGVLQIDLYVEVGSDGSTLAASLAWVFAHRALNELPTQLRLVSLPWRDDAPPETPLATPAPPDAHDLVELARRVRTLTLAMHDLRLGHDAIPYQQQTSDSDEAWEDVRSSVESFNQATARCGLSHSMSTVPSDPTWYPHNVRNTLELGSVYLSVKSDLARALGTQAAAIFSAAWRILGEASADTDEKLAELEASELEPESVDAVMQRDGAAPQVFVCYSWADKTRGARDVFESVRAMGRSAWIDEENRPNERTLDADVASMLLRAGVVVVCFSSELAIRGGYAQRELLLALSDHETHAPRSVVLVLLDRAPTASFLDDLPRISWFEPAARTQLATLLERVSAVPESRGIDDERARAPRGARIERLLALLPPPNRPVASSADADRWIELSRAAQMIEVIKATFAAWGESRTEAVVELWAARAELLTHVRLSDATWTSDPVRAGLAVRILSVLVRSRLLLGQRGDWKTHVPEAIALLEQMVSLEPKLLAPALARGWHIDDARRAFQDCMDALETCREWSRGWSPSVIEGLCGVPALRSEAVLARVDGRIREFGDLMFALRALQDRAALQPTTPSWEAARASADGILLARFAPRTSNPISAAYFEALRGLISVDVQHVLAVALADACVQTSAQRVTAEDFSSSLGNLRVRFAVRSYASRGSMDSDVANVRGTVLVDLRVGDVEDDTDLCVLLSQFVLAEPATPTAWKGAILLNVWPSKRALQDKLLPEALRGPYLIENMLDEQERRLSESEFPGGSVLEG